MTRQRLPDRRLNATRKVTWATYGGNEQSILVTFGFQRVWGPECEPQYSVAEIFCADFKAGSDTQAIVTDACVLISRLLQSSNDTVADLRKSMCEPPSLIGCILQAACDEEDFMPDPATAAIRTYFDEVSGHMVREKITNEEFYVGADQAKDEPIPVRVPWFTIVEEPVTFPWALTLLCFSILLSIISIVTKMMGIW